MLETVAPRPWARRMLGWHIFETSGTLDFYSGKIVDKISAFSLLELAAHDGLMDCEKRFVDQARNMKPTDEIAIGAREEGAPYSVPVEVALWLENFDWEAGSVKGSLQHAVFVYPEGFADIQSYYDESWVEVDLYDLRFDLAFIEMLAPNAPTPPSDLLSLNATTSTRREGGPGRRRKHDWDGAFSALIARAGKEPIVADPYALGAQADIANQLADWFAEQQSDIPAHSQLQDKAGNILRTIRRLTS